MNRILVTGGTGFLGSNLCERLIAQGHKVICIDNNVTGSINNIQKLLSNTNFEFVKHDIINPISIDGDFHQIYNLACPASPPAYQGKNAIFTTKTCVIGTLNILDFALKKQARVLHTSTSEVYGEPLEHPQSEQYRGNVNPIGTRACYDEGKRCAESIFFDYHREYNADIKIVRVFNTYGPNMDMNDGRVVSNFICQALKNDDLTVYGDGSQTRSFCYVDDLIDVLILMMNSEKTFSGPANIGNPSEFTVKELAEKVIEKTKSQSKIIYLALPQDDPTLRKPNINLVKEKLNWTPQINLDHGLDMTIQYYKSKLGI